MNRHSTSERQVRDLHRPDRHTPVNVVVKKSYDFVERVWAAYLASNTSDLRYMYMLICPDTHSDCRPLVEVGRDEDAEFQQNRMVLDDGNAGDDDTDDGEEG